MEDNKMTADEKTGEERTRDSTFDSLAIPQTATDKEAELLSSQPSMAPSVDMEHAGDDSGAPLERIATEDYPKSMKLVFIVVALVLSIFLVALDMTIVATAIPAITSQFHSLDQVGWYGSAFFLTLASFQSTWGKAYKFFPLKPTFLLSIAIFELGSLICAVSNDSTTLIVGRAVAGAGGAGIASGSYLIIALAAPPSQRAAFTGILGATYGTASVIGPLLGGVFTTNVTWRWCFYVNLPIGGAAAAIILLSFKAPAAARPQKATILEKCLQMDLVGTFLIMAAVVCYLLALQWGGVTKPWSDGSVIGALVAFVIALILFLINEWFMNERALLPRRLLRQRTIATMSAFVFFISGTFFILLYYLPIYFQAVDNVSPSQSGIRNLPLVVGASLFTIFSGVQISVTGHFIPMVIAGGVISTIASGLIYTLDIGSSSGQWIGYQALAGIGLGLAFQVPIIVNQASVPMSDLASVSAMTLFFQTIGGAFFVSAGETAFANKLLAVLPSTAPGVDPHTVVVTGATALRSVFSAADIPGILLAYMDGLKTSFALSIACAGMALVVGVMVEWKNIKGKIPDMGATA